MKDEQIRRHEERKKIKERNEQIDREITHRRVRIEECKNQIAIYKDLLNLQEQRIKELKKERNGRYSEELKSNPILRKYIREDIEE